jgi:C4-type Zn-finger protein
MKDQDNAPVALQCNGCGEWSKYSKDYIDKMPRSWEETDEGYFCKNCTKRSNSVKGKTVKERKKITL